MVSKQTPSKKTNSQKTNTKRHSPADAVIEGKFAGTHVLNRLRQISPVTAALMCAVILSLGVSLWPYLAPFFISSSDDRWQAEVEVQLSDLRSDLQALSEQQAVLTGQLQAVENKLTGIVQQTEDTASAFLQLSDALTADIRKLVSQSAHFAEQLAALNSFDTDQDKPAKQANSAVSSDMDPEAKSLLQHLPEFAVPNLSLPPASDWWQGISDWFGGLVSIERVQPEQEQQ